MLARQLRAHGQDCANCIASCLQAVSHHLLAHAQASAQGMVRDLQERFQAWVGIIPCILSSSRC